MQHCLKMANTIGKEINEEINETFSNAIEGTVVKFMVAELMLINLKMGFIMVNKRDGEFAFNELHSKIKSAIGVNLKGVGNGSREPSTGH